MVILKRQKNKTSHTSTYGLSTHSRFYNETLKEKSIGHKVLGISRPNKIFRISLHDDLEFLSWANKSSKRLETRINNKTLYTFENLKKIVLRIMKVNNTLWW